MSNELMDKYQDIMKIGFGGFEAVDDEIMAKYGRKFNKGEFLIKEGESAKDVFFILKGAVLVTKEVNTIKKIISVLGPGEIVGEMSLFESLKRSASCIADEDVEVIVFNDETFSEIYKVHPMWLDKILKSLSNRIVKTLDVLKERLVQ